MMDIRRICEQPTEEDKRWFPDFAGSDWQETLQFAMRNFKDESFIQQFLSPKIIRDLKLFCALDDDAHSEIEIMAIHDDSGYHIIREQLAGQYNLGDREPNIQITNIDIRGDRSMHLQHHQHNRKPLNEDSEEVLKHLHNLWGFDIHLDSLQDGEVVSSYHCPNLGSINDEDS